MASKQTWQAWLRVCTREPGNPIQAPKGALGILTSQDTRALSAIVACWELYSNSDDDGQQAALVAIRSLLLGMQPKSRYLAREVIPFVLDWGDRDRLWPLVAISEAA